MPESGRGNVLVTCRSEFLAESVAASSIEIPTFSTDESTTLIFKILNKTDAGEDETLAANDLSEQLGGLALAIDIMSENIKRRFQSVREFLPHYEQNRHSLHKLPEREVRDPTYSKDLDTVWRLAFESLDESVNPGANGDAARLLQLLCFVAPEAIPQWLFQTTVADCPAEWRFLYDDIRCVVLAQYLSCVANLGSPGLRRRSLSSSTCP